MSLEVSYNLIQLSINEFHKVYQRIKTNILMTKLLMEEVDLNYLQSFMHPFLLWFSDTKPSPQIEFKSKVNGNYSCSYLFYVFR